MVASWIISGAITAAITERRLRAHSETPELDDDIEAFRAEVNQRLDALSAIVKHPEVVETLRRIHNQQKGAP